MLTLSLVAPAYNEADQIADVVSEWDAYLSKDERIDRFEIIVCNDGSSDPTGEILDAISRELESLRPLHLSPNQGAAAALATAIRASRFDLVLVIDSDRQFPIENLTSLLDTKIESGGSAVIGARPRKENGIGARLGSRVSGGISNRIYGSNLRDFNCALKLVDGALLRSIPLEARGLNYSTEHTARLLERGVELIEIDVCHEQRRAGKSSMRFLRDAVHRLLFVSYLAYRRLLISRGVLRSES